MKREEKVLYMYLEDCPYCRAATAWIKELTEEYPQYRDIKIQMVEESEYPEFADSLDYYFVPTFYINDEKVHEGAATKELIKAVLEKALSA